MPRYLVSWWADSVLDPELVPFRYWWSGQRFGKPSHSVVALIDSDTESNVWKQVVQWFPDAHYRFISGKPDGWLPGDRFPTIEPESKPSELDLLRAVADAAREEAQSGGQLSKALAALDSRT